MSNSDTKDLLACTDDAEFKKKYLIAAACGLGSFFVIPAFFFLGYLAQSMKRATLGRKGLPEWTNFPELGGLGVAGLLSMIYLLPSALLAALAVLPRLGTTSVTFFSASALVSRFIDFGSFLAFGVGLAFTVCALHTYLTTQRFPDIFNFASLWGQVKTNKGRLGFLIGSAALAYGVVLFLSWLLSWFGILISTLGLTFISLVVAYNSGAILGPTIQAALPESTESSALEAVIEESAPEAERAEAKEDGGDEDRWVPT